MVLLTAVGSASAACALESLRAQGWRVIGCDIYPQAWNDVSCRVDAFFQAPRAADDAEAYGQWLASVVRREGVQAVMPLTDPEVDALCGQRERFAALGCALVMPPDAAARLCRDKLAMARRLEACGACQVIPTFEAQAYQPTAYPVLLKPRSGRSSQRQTLARTPEAYRAALSQNEDLIAQPYVEGCLFTVDVARDAQGNVQALARQEYLRATNGLGVTVRTFPGHALEAVCARIAACAGIVGVVNMEFIERGGVYWFLEVNPRLSGGVGFSAAAGMDFPALAMECALGRPLPAPSPARALTMTRRVQPVVTQIHSHDCNE